MVKTVLCERDSLRQDLCFDCRKKLEANEFTELDASVSRLVGKISKNFALTDIVFHKALDANDFVVLLCTGKIGSIIGKKGRIVSELSKNIGKKVRVIEKTKNEKKMIEDLLGSVRVLGVEKIFTPNAVQSRVWVVKQDESKLVSSKQNLENVLEGLLGYKAFIEFK